MSNNNNNTAGVVQDKYNTEHLKLRGAPKVSLWDLHLEGDTDGDNRPMLTHPQGKYLVPLFIRNEDNLKG